MPLNKNASFRYRVINDCLRNTGRRWTLEDLREHISEKLFEEFDIVRGISLRQLAEDIHIMRKLPPTGYDAPIKRRNGYVYYEDPNFSIDQNPLTESDVEALDEALNILKQFKDLPHFEELKRILYKIQGSVSLLSKKKALIQFETNPLVKGTEWIPTISDCIGKKKPLSITYKSFKSLSNRVEIVYPYLLKEYRNRWFMIGYNDTYKSISTYALDRIERTKPENIKWIENSFFDPDHYFDNIIGVTVLEDSPIEKIQIKLSPEIYPYILTKPIHKSQKIIKEDSSEKIIQIEIIPNFEFESLVLSYGEEVEIVLPPHIRDKIKSRLNLVKKIYDPS